jgi:WD40 repeat protein
MRPSADDATIETEDGHRLTLRRRFGNPAFKHRDHHLRLLGWDPAGAILHLQATLSAVPSVESWDVRTGERLPPTTLTRGAPVAGLAIDAACSPLLRWVEGTSVANVTELWDLRAGEYLTAFPNRDCAVSPDGRFVVGGIAPLAVHALPGRTRVASLPGDPQPIAVSSDGSRIASWARSPCRLTVSRPDGTPVTTLAPPGPGWPAAVTAVGFSRDGRRVIAGLDDGEVVCWEVATGALRWRIRPYGDDSVEVLAVAGSIDGETFFTCDLGNRLCAISSAAGEGRWRTSLGKNLRVYPPSCELLPSPDGARLAVSTTGRLARILDAATGADRTPVEGHRGRLVALALSPDGRLAASGDEEGEVRVHDLARGDTVWTLEAGGGAVSGVEFTPDGRSLLTAGGGCVRRWNLATGFEEAHRQIRSGDVGIVGAPDGARLLVIPLGGIELWSDRAATPVQWSRRVEYQSEAAFSDAEARVVVAHFDDPDADEAEWSLVTLDAETGREVSEPEAMPGRWVGLRSTDDGPLSVSHAGERVVAREAFGARREVVVREASAAVSVVAVSGDGRWMALADEGCVEVWSLAPPARCVARVRPVDRLDEVARIALSHDGGVLVVGTACGVVAAYTRTEGDG